MSAHLYAALVYLHLLAALLWLGGMFFFALVGAPVLRGIDPPELRRRLFHDLGLGFRRAGWWAIGVLVVSGTGILYLRGVLRWSVFGDALFWGTAFGRALAWKLVLVGIMLSASAVHDFVTGPGAAAGGAEGERARRRSALLARANAVAGLLLVYWASRLARGG